MRLGQLYCCFRAVLVPNPAHSQFIARESSDPREETLSLPAARARQLLNLPAGDSVLAHRDRAIVKLYLYSGIRLATGCSLLVEDFRHDGEEATLRLPEKGQQAPDPSDPREETLSLPAARARQLLNLPAGDSVLAHRDRAIVKLYLYSGIRLATGCSLLVEDFRQEGEEATLRLSEKGDKRRTIGLHYVAAQAIQEYIQRAELRSGPLFRPRRHSHTEELAGSAMEPRTMWTILKEYLSKLPNALR
jgi:site-specific recombinase XerC